MYATLTYDVSAGQTPIDEVRRAALDLFKDRATCDLLSDTFICTVANTADYLELARQLRTVGADLDGQLHFVFTLHAKGSPLRSNAAFPKAKAREIIEPGDEP